MRIDDLLIFLFREPRDGVNKSSGFGISTLPLSTEAFLIDTFAEAIQRGGLEIKVAGYL